MFLKKFIPLALTPICALAAKFDPKSVDLPDPHGNPIPNFTFAGIPGGIPKVETKVMLSKFGGLPDDGVADDDALEAAVEYLASIGGGAIKLEAGTYKMTRPLVIKHDNTVLRGAGMDQTKIVFVYKLQPGEIRLVGIKEGQTLLRSDFLESHVDIRRLKRHQIWVNDQLLFERLPDYSGGDRFDLKLPINNFLSKLKSGPATVRAVATRWDGTEDVDEVNIILDVDSPLEKGKWQDAPKVASIAFVGDRRSNYRGRMHLAVDGKRGDTSIELQNPVPDQFQPGDLIVVEAKSTPEFVKSIGSWRKDIPRRQMLVVEKAQGRRIELNQPLRIDFPVRDEAYAFGRKPIRNSGIEHLTLEHKKKQWIDGILFSPALHCWVKGVRIQKAGRNPLSLGGKQSQVEDSEFNGAWYLGGGGTGYVGFSGCYDMLYQRVSATGLRHAPVIQSAASGNVFRDSTFYSSDINYHMQWAPENLIEQIELDAKRGTGSYGYAVYAQKPDVAIHGPGGGPRNILWNNRFKSPRPGLFLGGSNDGWTISYNHFEVEKGPGAILRKNSSNHIIQGNTFQLADKNAAVFEFETDDNVGNSLIGNLSNTHGTLTKGKVRLAADKQNRLKISGEVPEPSPPTPSLYLWQMEQVGLAQ